MRVWILSNVGTWCDRIIAKTPSVKITLWRYIFLCLTKHLCSQVPIYRSGGEYVYRFSWKRPPLIRSMIRMSPCPVNHTVSKQPCTSKTTGVTSVTEEDVTKIPSCMRGTRKMPGNALYVLWYYPLKYIRLDHVTKNCTKKIFNE
jgi:hypothetical protein